MKPKLKPPGTERLKLEYDGLLSDFGFNFILRRHNEDGKTFENVGGMWIEVAEMDADKMKHAEKNMGHASGIVVSKMKESEAGAYTRPLFGST